MISLHAIARRAPLIVLSAALAALAAPASAATASAGSDSIAGAAPLGFTNPGTGSSVGFTVEGGEPLGSGCPDDEGATAWWRITGNGQTITLSTSGSNFNTVLAVYNQGAGAPTTGNRIACNDNDVAPAQTSKLSFASERAKTYLVQVGGRFAASGSIVLTATAPRPANDDRAAARALQTGVALTSTNGGATQEPGEGLTCGIGPSAVPFAATIWFRWAAPAVGDAVFASSATFTDTVLVVHRTSDGAVMGCNDDAGQAGGPSRLAVRVAPGEDYLLQVGAKGIDSIATGQGDVTAAATFTLDPDVDNDGVLQSGDCNDRDPLVRPGAAEILDDGIDQNCDGGDAINLDRDADGAKRPLDCNDADPKIHPGVRDIPGNKIDEDCTDGPAPYPQIASSIRSFARYPPFRFTALDIVRAVKGSRIELRCRGRGCFKRKVILVRRSKRIISLLPHVRRARLRRGAVAEIRVTKRGYVGVMRRITVRAGRRQPRLNDFCLPVGKRPPKPC